MANAINVISPYRAHGMWVFDDPAKGLVQEPFVGGADTWFDMATADIPNARQGVVAVFSAGPFPGYAYRLERRRPEGSGTVYYSPELDIEGWLCPALLRYFDEPPAEIYVQLRPKAD